MDSLCDKIDAGNLLEALDDHSQRRTSEVLVGATGEELPERRLSRGSTGLSGDSFLDTQIGELYRLVRVRLILECTNDSKSFGVATLLC